MNINGKIMNYLSFFSFAMIITLIAMSVFYGCDSDECNPEETRCNGSIVEICNYEENWEYAINCDKIEDFDAGIDWMCCIDPYDGVNSCLPSDECK